MQQESRQEQPKAVHTAGNDGPDQQIALKRCGAEQHVIPGSQKRRLYGKII